MQVHKQVGPENKRTSTTKSSNMTLCQSQGLPGDSIERNSGTASIRDRLVPRVNSAQGEANTSAGHALGQTCKGVWPRVSRSGRVSDTGWSGGSSVMIMLSTLACRPACSRTPDASYITCTAGVLRVEGRVRDHSARSPAGRHAAARPTHHT